MYTLIIRRDRKEPVSLQNVSSSQTLLEVCLNNGIELNHECGGICSCKTCHIYVEKGRQFMEETSKREKDLLKKLKNAQLSSRLACQCLLLDGEGHIEVTIPPAA